MTNQWLLYSAGICIQYQLNADALFSPISGLGLFYCFNSEYTKLTFLLIFYTSYNSCFIKKFLVSTIR